jgi:hypothetical protein
MLSPRERALSAIRKGDVIFAITSGGRGLLLLVEKATLRKIFARHVPSLGRAEFGRDGKSTWCTGGGSCTIVSTAALPREQYDVVIGLDRKRRKAETGADQKLTRAEIDLLLNGDDFFKARQLPE